MKSLLFSFFLILSASSFGQIREEIIERFEDGSKKKVITYSGVGNSEKIVKISFYDNRFLYPWKVVTYGSKTESNGTTTWQRIKEEYFKSGGSPVDEVRNL
jgi:hypothetical protein